MFADREQLDEQLAPSLETLGDRQVEAAAKTIAYRLDPHGFMARIKGVHADRRVSLRPAPDTMSLLSGFLPVKASRCARRCSSTLSPYTLKAVSEVEARSWLTHLSRG